ncbi:ABC transporter ATP-binding protein [Permianibacter sp. IMCC34836]|uniref:ABC transporter ATP-binding protein n=1 Tax=Permianibacter fluminis TaxID=2738515 RepID=UPI0015575A4A|nr:ABC transporter ATP-binding protein [Permianibacter fluminis]NQD37108.1 ABC transporter ATP-binding protein [Permianibacter fluminis]
MLELENVSKAYAGKRAVHQLSLQIRAGEIFGLLGPNGAGKSTSCALITGLLAPDSGSVCIAGTDPRQHTVRRRIGLAPQKLALYERLSARANLQFFASLYGITGLSGNEAVGQALAQVGLTERAEDPVSTFSGGMLRRLNLAGALVHNPDLLLLDEPTAGVDPQSRSRLFDTVLALKAAGKTVIYTTHYMEEAERLCDRVAILDNGRLLALDTVPALLRQYGGASEIVLRNGHGQRQISTTDPLATLRELLATDTSADLLEVRPPTLESAFLNLTGKHLRD